MVKLNNKNVKWAVRIILGALLVTGVNSVWIGSGNLIPYLVPGTGTVTVDEYVKDESVSTAVFGSGTIKNVLSTLPGAGPIASSIGSASGGYVTEMTLHTIYNPNSVLPDICFAKTAEALTSTGTAVGRCLVENTIDRVNEGVASGGTLRITWTGANLANFWAGDDVITIHSGVNSKGFKGQLSVDYDDALGR